MISEHITIANSRKKVKNIYQKPALSVCCGNMTFMRESSSQKFCSVCILMKWGLFRDSCPILPKFDVVLTWVSDISLLTVDSLLPNVLKTLFLLLLWTTTSFGLFLLDWGLELFVSLSLRRTSWGTTLWTLYLSIERLLWTYVEAFRDSNACFSVSLAFWMLSGSNFSFFPIPDVEA